MTYPPDRHHRRSIRLQGYDYSGVGAYFVTICTQDRECLFGEIEAGEMRLNDAGWMVKKVWDELPVFYLGVKTDAFVVMPNHIHGIIILVGAGPRACPEFGAGAGFGAGPGHGADAEQGQPRGAAPTGVVFGTRVVSGTGTGSLGDVVHRLKTMWTKRYADGVKQQGWRPFRGRLWQRNYYEHIVRDEASLQSIREYVANNPLQWEMDSENPAVAGRGASSRSCHVR